MKVSFLVINIVLPMLISIGLYTYGLLSTRWNCIDEDLINQYNETNKLREGHSPINNSNVQLESLLIRHGFRTHYGLFGSCIDYKWLYLYTIKSKLNKDYFCRKCNDTSLTCPETGCCVCKTFKALFLFKNNSYIFDR